MAGRANPVEDERAARSAARRASMHCFCGEFKLDSEERMFDLCPGCDGPLEVANYARMTWKRKMGGWE